MIASNLPNAHDDLRRLSTAKPPSGHRDVRLHLRQSPP
jgi:hypothetical protein